MHNRFKVVVCFSLFLAIAFWAFGCEFISPAGGNADVIYHNGSIYTETGSLADGAVALKDGIIKAVGPAADVLAQWRSETTRVEDLAGGYVYPGLFDSLGSIFKLATSLNRVDLLSCQSFDQAVARVKAVADQRPEGTWIIGMGWDQTLWETDVLPTHQQLSAAVPNHPVWLWRIDTMCGLANQKAMDVCRIKDDTPAPRGGVIGKDKKGQLNGLFIQTAVDLLEDRIPVTSRSEIKRRLAEAQNYCFERGLTGIFVPGLERFEVDLLKRMVDEGSWKLPICLSYRSNGDPDALAGLVPLTNYKGVMEARCLSIYLDGGLGSRGAALLDDYTDEPVNKGILNYTPDEVLQVASAAYKSGFQLSLHCVGDRAAQVALDAIGQTFPTAGAGERRWRIEHSQMVTKEDRKRYQQYGVIPSMQPTHCPSDMDWAPNRVGQGRIERLYNWRAFTDLGLKIAGGSFFPAEPVNPLYGIYAAITSKNENGLPQKGYRPKAILTRKEAIDLFTMNAAYAVCQENRRGAIKVGHEAHFTVYDRDLLKVAERDILKANVLLTIINGQIVFKRNKTRHM